MRVVRELADCIHMLDSRRTVAAEYQLRSRADASCTASFKGKSLSLITPDDENHLNVRTRMHEYGGRSFVVEDGIVYFSNFANQRLYRQNVGQQPRPITPPRTGALPALIRDSRRQADY
jgi:hypothetical protein